MDNRIVDTGYTPEDSGVEVSLRPHTLRDYVGQPQIKENLGIAIEAALRRRDALDHVLLYGPPGLGKTTMACIIAAEMGQNVRITSGPAIERPGDLAAILTNLNAGDVLFIDEIHRLSRSVEEVLYPAMEDFAIDIMIGKGPTARSVRLDLPHFTLVGATTRAGMLSSPLRDRFGLICRLEMYSPEDLAKIIGRSASILGVRAEPAGVLEIARRSRGTPRIANRLLKRVRDHAEVCNNGLIDKETAIRALDRLEVDPLGLDKIDRSMLLCMMERFGGGPVGLDTLAATVGEDPGTIEDVYEPYLMQLGFIQRTPRGRSCLPPAWRHLGKVPPTAVPPAEDTQLKMDL